MSDRIEVLKTYKTYIGGKSLELNQGDITKYMMVMMKYWLMLANVHEKIFVML
ncbi:MAG: hypothetical protein U5J95_03335 [Balneolaceae bacterium]|nr:hypothetical protein [Balneolaceae bacterium]